AGIPLDLRTTPLGLMMASANKCLQGMPGISFVFVRRDLLRAMAQYPPRSYYTALPSEHAAVEKSGQMRFTPAVQVLYALRQAIDETFAETLEGRFARYRANWEALCRGMLKAGFEKLLPDEHESGLITSFFRPAVPQYDFDRHHDLLLEAGYTIYPAMVGYEETFRLGNIGQITTAEINGFLQANGEVLKTMGVKPPFYPS
ncbi:MAG: 2-aminoethylphosphonate aminotransferase, partial [Planctomycetota bacterium]